MAGLLDFLSNIKYEPNALSQGLLSMGANMLASSGPSTTPVGFGQSLGQGLLGFQQGVGSFQQQELARKLQELQLASQTPEAQRNKIMTEALARSEAEKLYPKAPSIPTGFTRGEGGAITPMPIAGPSGPTDYMGYQMEMARQKAQIPGYGEDLRLKMALENQQFQKEAAARKATLQEQNLDIAKEKLDLLKQTAVRGKQLPLSQIDKITADQATLENATRLQNTFKPEYGGHYITGQGDLRNIVGRTFGTNPDETQWWQDYQMQKNKVRKELFGATLTPTEELEWKKAAVEPTMEPGQIQRNIERQTAIEKRGYARRLENIKKGGYDVSGFENTPYYEKQGNVTMDFKGGLSPEDKATIEEDKAKTTPEGWTDQEEADYQQFLKSRGGK